MKFLLTSGGITNASIHAALVDLLGKPIAECSALFIPTAMYAYPRHAAMAWQAFAGKARSPLCELGWKSLGVLELTALPSLSKKIGSPLWKRRMPCWCGGGDPVYLADWMRRSGLAELLPSLRDELVYVGVSAGSMAVSSTFSENYTRPPNGDRDALRSENFSFATAEGEVTSLLVTAHGAVWVDFALIPHFNNPDHPDASLENAGKWAARMPLPVYAIDDQTAIAVSHGAVEVVSEGQWKLFLPTV
jgi:dipeptidase E